MSFKDTLKKALFEEEGGNNSQATSSAAQPTSNQPVIAPMQNPVAKAVDSVVEVDEKLLDVIEGKIKEANIPGPDYLELKEAAEEKSFVADEPDEAKRWRMAYRNMRQYFPKADITKGKILSAIDHYIGIVRNEINVGMAELKELKARDVTQEQAAVANLDKEIAKLEKELEAKKSLKCSKVAKIEESLHKYDHQEQVFNCTTTFVVNMLEKDKEKINKFISD